MADLTRCATPATVPQQPENRLLQTPPCNTAATIDPATVATALQHRCNKVQQHRNSVIFGPRNSATTPYRGGGTVAPLYPPPALSLWRLRLRLRAPSLRADRTSPRPSKGIYAPDLPQTKSSEGREAAHHARPLAGWKTCFRGKCGVSRSRQPVLKVSAMARRDSAVALDSLNASARCPKPGADRMNSRAFLRLLSSLRISKPLTDVAKGLWHQCSSAGYGFTSVPRQSNRGHTRALVWDRRLYQPHVEQGHHPHRSCMEGQSYPVRGKKGRSHARCNLPRAPFASEIQQQNLILLANNSEKLGLA
jgi:hypothetical protein